MKRRKNPLFCKTHGKFVELYFEKFKDDKKNKCIHLTASDAPGDVVTLKLAGIYIKKPKGWHGMTGVWVVARDWVFKEAGIPIPSRSSFLTQMNDDGTMVMDKKENDGTGLLATFPIISEMPD